MTPPYPEGPQRDTTFEPGVSHVSALLEQAGQAERYQALAQIGAGGIGVVYKATDTRLNRAVAIKAIHTSRLTDPRIITRLRSEALAAASLDHPYICKIYELIEQDGEQLIVMEFVEGETLGAILSRGIPPLGTTIRQAIEIGEGLAAAHARGLVHRDLKPGNVMVTPSGHIKLLDFGLAQVDSTTTPDADTHTPPPVSDAYAGTPHYMAPEQAAGRAVTARTDVFALGVVLFRAVTGRLPFDGTTLYGYTSNLLSKDPTPLHRLAPDTPVDLARLIDRCLEKTPSERPESATEVVTELRKVADALSSATGFGRSVQDERTRVRLRIVAVAAALAIVAFGVWRWRASRDLDDVVWQARPLATSSSAESSSRLSPDGQWLSYLSSTGGSTRVMVRRMDGGEARSVAIAGGTPLSQLWSPDGSKLAYITRLGTEAFLQVVPAFFGGVAEQSVQLSPAPVGEVRLSRWIGDTVYVDAPGRSRSLRRVNLGDGTNTNVSDAWKLEGRLTGLDVSADGRRVAYSLLTNDQEDLWVANIDGTGAKRLTDDRFFERSPIWSGRGMSVIYQSNRGGQTDLWEVGVASSRSRPLTSSPTVEDPESTSADGRLITFNQLSESSNLWVWRAPAGGSGQLTDDALGDRSPSAGGGTIVFQRSAPSSLPGNPLANSMLFSGALERSKLRSAATPLAEGFAPRLSPDGTRVAYLQRGSDPQHVTLIVRDLKRGEAVQVSTTCPLPAYSTVSLDWVDQNLAWDTSGSTLYFVDRPDNYVIRRYRTGAAAPDAPLVTAGTREIIQDVHLSSDGQALAYVLVAKGATLHLFDLQAGAEESATPLEGTVAFRGWLPGEASLIVLRQTQLLEDQTSNVEVLEVSMRGMVRPIGSLDRVLFPTIRLDRLRSVMYLTRSEDGVHNLYEYSLATRTLRRITDNTAPGVSFSGLEPLQGGAILGFRLERKSDIWQLDAADASTRPPGR